MAKKAMAPVILHSMKTIGYWETPIAPGSTIPAAEVASTPVSAQKSILIVDDDQALRQSLLPPEGKAEQLHMYEEFAASATLRSPPIATMSMSSGRPPLTSSCRGSTKSSPTSKDGREASTTGCVASICRPISMSSSFASTAAKPATLLSARSSASPPMQNPLPTARTGAMCISGKGDILHSMKTIGYWETPIAPGFRPQR